MALAVSEKAMKAMMALKSSAVSVIFMAKKRGRKMKRFFTYWWGRMSLMSEVGFNTAFPSPNSNLDYTKNLLYPPPKHF